MPKTSQLDRAIAQIEGEIALLQNTLARLLAVKEPVTPRKPRRKAASPLRGSSQSVGGSISPVAHMPKAEAQ